MPPVAKPLSDLNLRRLPVLLSLNGGYLDTAGFLALHGLFTAHVTGNFVTIGASFAHGTSGAVAKLLALPVFCVVVVLTRLLAYRLPGWGLPVLRTMLTLKLLLLCAGAVLAIRLGPFADGDSWDALLTSLVLVAAMAIQNAAHRIHLAFAPPTTLMTGTTTQLMIDLADLLHGGPDQTGDAIRPRLRTMATSVLVFAAGCLAAAALYILYGMWCFAVPPVLALGALWLQRGPLGEAG
ncbi:MAG: DUF1275 family protein [Rhodoferax sp.]|nr:DUF1275 family protein [Rhodoferax sp.]